MSGVTEEFTKWIPVLERKNGKTTQKRIRQTVYKIARENSQKINIPDTLKGASKQKWLEKYGRHNENATMMKRDVIDIQAHFAKCYAERALLCTQEVPLFGTSEITSCMFEARGTEGVAV